MRCQLSASSSVPFRVSEDPKPCLTCPSVGAFNLCLSNGLPDPRGPSFESRALLWYPPSYTWWPREPCSRFSPGLSPQRHSLLGSSCSRTGVTPSSPPAYPRLRGTCTGFPCSASSKCDRRGCLVWPGTVAITHLATRPRVTSAFQPQSSYPAQLHHSRFLANEPLYTRFAFLILPVFPGLFSLVAYESWAFPGLSTSPLPATHPRAGN